jgi:hypothetical protein
METKKKYGMRKHTTLNGVCRPTMHSLSVYNILSSLYFPLT